MLQFHNLWGPLYRELRNCLAVPDRIVLKGCWLPQLWSLLYGTATRPSQYTT
jgi:hypothetical protein